jgi:hypothetical protein
MSAANKELQRLIERIAREVRDEGFSSHGVGPGVRIVTGAGGGGGGGDIATDTLWDAKGDVAVASGANAANRLAVGTDGQVLTADSAAPLGVAWTAPNPPSFSGTMITEWNNRATYSASGTAFAWKGQRFTPFRAIELHGIGWMGAVVAGATYQAAVVTESGGLIATITKSSTVTLPGTLAGTDRVETWLPFATPVTLLTGTLYYLMVGRTDSTDTTAFGISSTSSTAVPSVAMPGFGGTNAGQYPRIAKANPAVGDAIDLTQNAVPAMGWMYRLP